MFLMAYLSFFLQKSLKDIWSLEEVMWYKFLGWTRRRMYIYTHRSSCWFFLLSVSPLVVVVVVVGLLFNKLYQLLNWTQNIHLFMWTLQVQAVIPAASIDIWIVEGPDCGTGTLTTTFLRQALRTSRKSPKEGFKGKKGKSGSHKFWSNPSSLLQIVGILIK